MRRFLPLLLLLAAVFPAGAEDVVFAGYNLQNYAPVPTLSGATRRSAPHKSAQSAAAVVEILKEIGPDILGVCEMGPPEQFAEFRQRLADAGLVYADAEFLEAADPDRHLALLSRFPIVARHSVAHLSYDLGGLREKMRRGILDVTVRVGPNSQLRIVCAHLKSRLPSPGGEERERRNEAHLLRQHLDRILAADPDTPLLVFGDFNDSKNQPAVREITDAVEPLPLADSAGERWTYYWATDDSYQRIDYLLASRALLPRVIPRRSYIVRSPQWSRASDHRPLVVTLNLDK